MSYNVNGIRAFESKVGGNLNQWMLEMGCHIYCFQEIKGTLTSLKKYQLLKDFHGIFSYHPLNGRHGVVTYLKRNNTFLEKSIQLEKGRIVKSYHSDYILYNCYMPYYNGCKDKFIEDYEAGEEFDDKVKSVYELLEEDVRKTVIDKSKKVIVVGDLNAVYNLCDSYLYYNEYKKLVIAQKWSNQYKYKIDVNNQPKVNSDSIDLFPEIFYNNLLQIEKNGRVNKVKSKDTEIPYFFLSVEELEKYFFIIWQRKWLFNFIDNFDLLDTFREYDKSLDVYTCWDISRNLKSKNMGSRIDYVLSNFGEVIESKIILDFNYSDHVPIITKLRWEDCNVSTLPSNIKNLVTEKPNNLLKFFKK